jgi:hypothetical protein
MDLLRFCTGMRVALYQCGRAAIALQGQVRAEQPRGCGRRCVRFARARHLARRPGSNDGGNQTRSLSAA